MASPLCWMTQEAAGDEVKIMLNKSLTRATMCWRAAGEPVDAAIERRMSETALLVWNGHCSPL